MAVTLLKSTPYSAVYRAESLAGGEVFTIDYTDAPTMAALVPGPYKYQIRQWLGSLDHVNGNDASTRPRRIRIYQVSGISLQEIDPGTYSVIWVVNGLQITFPAESAGTLLLEIRFVHSSRR
jgi:hypothetical protein